MRAKVNAVAPVRGKLPERGRHLSAAAKCGKAVTRNEHKRLKSHGLGKKNG